MRDIWDETPSQFDLNNEQDFDSFDEMLYSEPSEKIESAFDLNQREKSVVSDAMVRLDQARLYEMLIKHDMFDGVEANQVALENVKRELKGFIVERLEFLLGIRVEQKTQQSVPQDANFSEDEVAFLKMLAQRGTQKFSNESKATEPKPLATQQKAPAPQTLKGVANIPKQQVKPVSQPTQPAKKQVESRPAQTSKSNLTYNDPQSKKLDQIAREDLKNLKGRKKVSEMTEQELIEENNRASQRYKKSPTPPQALPVPDDSQLHSIYMQRELNKSMTKSGEEGLQLSIAQALLKNK